MSILGVVPSHGTPQQALDLIGCADALVERGIKVTTMNYYDRSFSPLMGVDFNGLIGKTRFPFCLLLPQHITEGILTQKLNGFGVSIFRSHKATGMRENSKNSRLVDVSFENGQSITAQYVIGADGSQSAVRTWIPLSIIPMLTVTVRYANYQASPLSIPAPLLIALRRPTPWRRWSLQTSHLTERPLFQRASSPSPAGIVSLSWHLSNIPRRAQELPLKGKSSIAWPVVYPLATANLHPSHRWSTASN